MQRSDSTGPSISMVAATLHAQTIEPPADVREEIVGVAQLLAASVGGKWLRVAHRRLR